MFLGPLIKERDQETTYSASSPSTLWITASQQENHSFIGTDWQTNPTPTDLMSPTSSPSPIRPRESQYYPISNNGFNQNAASHAHNRSFGSTNSTAASLEYTLHSSGREEQGKAFESGNSQHGASPGHSTTLSGEGTSSHPEVGIPFRPNASGHPY